MQIEQKVKEIASEVFCVDLDKVTNESTLESLGADSLDVTEFAMTLEDEFDITIEDEACGNIDTIQGFVDLVVNFKVA